MNLTPQDLSVFHLSVLGALAQHPDEDTKGEDIRAFLRKHGYKKSVPAFSMAMRKLQENELVAGQYVTRNVSGHTVREKIFRITDDGLGMLNQAQVLFKEMAFIF